MFAVIFGVCKVVILQSQIYNTQHAFFKYIQFLLCFFVFIVPLVKNYLMLCLSPIYCSIAL